MEPFFRDYVECVKKLHEDFKIAISGLPQAALDWVPGPEMNSLCVLVVHTCGSARYWVGDVALGDVSNRDRAAEFRANGLDEGELIARLDETENYIHNVVARLDLEGLGELRPAPGRDRQFVRGWALLHTLEHSGQHLGHAQITRQLWDQRVI